MSESDPQIAQVLQRVDRQVWIVTAADGSRRGGLLATWISEASLDRQQPTMLAGIAPNHFTAELIESAGSFGLHLIGHAHSDRAFNFALGSGRERDKLAGLATRTEETGAPILEDCLAWLDCRVYAALRTGDRNFYWADVMAGAVQRDSAPLTEEQLIELATDQQRAQLRADREADIARQRPWQAAWRNSLPELLQFPKRDSS